jgi:hypothetical protein
MTGRCGECPALHPSVIDELCVYGGAAHSALTNVVSLGTLGLMAHVPQRLDPDRRRRRLELLAALADAKSAREHSQPQRLRGARLRELIANRRRHAT